MWTYHNTHFELKEAQPELVVLPLAATEPHGRHLPFGTDTLVMTAIAERVAEQLPWRTYLLPTLPLGTSQVHRGQPGAISLSFETLFHVVTDLVESLLAQDIRKVAVLNNHGLASGNRTRPHGNYVVKTAVRQLNYDHPELDAVWVQPFVAAGSELAEIFESAPDDVHAGEVETSVLLHLAAGWVQPSEEDHVPTVPKGYLDFAAFEQICADGVWGRPTLASAEKGAAALEAAIRATVAYVEESFAALDQMKGAH